MRARQILATALGLALLAAAPAARAGDGFLDGLFGGGRGATPPNPFASNLPSAPPPPALVREERARMGARTPRPGRPAAPVPPAEIPED